MRESDVAPRSTITPHSGQWLLAIPRRSYPHDGHAISSAIARFGLVCSTSTFTSSHNANMDPSNLQVRYIRRCCHKEWYRHPAPDFPKGLRHRDPLLTTPPV